MSTKVKSNQNQETEAQKLICIVTPGENPI